MQSEHFVVLFHNHPDSIETKTGYLFLYSKHENTLKYLQKKKKIVINNVRHSNVIVAGDRLCLRGKKKTTTKKKTRAPCVSELIKSTARKKRHRRNSQETTQKRNAGNGNPRRIWLQWHSNGNIAEARPLSSAFFILFLYFLPALLLQSDPAAVGGGGGTRRVQHKPTVLPTMPKQPGWTRARMMVAAPGVHRKLQVVLGCSQPPPSLSLHHPPPLQPISTGFREDQILRLL